VEFIVSAAAIEQVGAFVSVPVARQSRHY
jgi:hypothetical protein